MPAYKYTLKNGKTLWYVNFYYTDWTGEKKHICKRGFKTQREAKDYERSFMNQQSNTSDILFSSLVTNYLEDMKHIFISSALLFPMLPADLHGLDAR